MHIYIASKFENKKAVQEAISVLAGDGHVISRDWTGENAAGKTGESLRSYLNWCAELDLHGVLEPHVKGLLLIDHDPAPRGGYTEFGLALAKRRLGSPMCIVVLNGLYHYGTPQNIFFTLAEVTHVQTLQGAADVFRAFEGNRQDSEDQRKSLIAPFAYKPRTPRGYECAACRSVGCKLWRPASILAANVLLRCIWCAEKDQLGMRFDATSLMIGNLGPAVPTEDGGTFWGFTSIPDDGIWWWRNLPTCPAPKEH